MRYEVTTDGPGFTKSTSMRDADTPREAARQAIVLGMHRAAIMDDGQNEGTDLYGPYKRYTARIGRSYVTAIVRKLRGE